MYEEWHTIIFQKRDRAILCILVEILQSDNLPLKECYIILVWC